jgi:hypothetical protein
MLLFTKLNLSKLSKTEEKTNLELKAGSLLILNDKIIKNKSTDNFLNKFSFKTTNEKINSESVLSNVNFQAPCNPEPDCQNILTGWMKLLEMSDSLPNLPNKFITNNQFFLQKSENHYLDNRQKDLNGSYVNIPSEEYFYFELNKNQLKVFTSRSTRYRKLDRFLNLNDLIQETSLNPCKGGVEDIGNFAEGYCFMVKYTHFGRYYVWELCADSSMEKDRWMMTLAKLNESNKSSNSITYFKIRY